MFNLALLTLEGSPWYSQLGSVRVFSIWSIFVFSHSLQHSHMHELPPQNEAIILVVNCYYICYTASDIMLLLCYDKRYVATPQISGYDLGMNKIKWIWNQPKQAGCGEYPQNCVLCKLQHSFLCIVNNTRALIGLCLLMTSQWGQIQNPWQSLHYSTYSYCSLDTYPFFH